MSAYQCISAYECMLSLTLGTIMAISQQKEERSRDYACSCRKTSMFFFVEHSIIDSTAHSMYLNSLDPVYVYAQPR